MAGLVKLRRGIGVVVEDGFGPFAIHIG